MRARGGLRIAAALGLWGVAGCFVDPGSAGSGGEAGGPTTSVDRTTGSMETSETDATSASPTTSDAGATGTGTTPGTSGAGETTQADATTTTGGPGSTTGPVDETTKTTSGGGTDTGDETTGGQPGCCCDPVAQDCPEGDVCIPSPDETQMFICAIDASGEEGQLFDPCEFANICDPGLFCTDASVSEKCDPNSSGCCIAFCSLEGAGCPSPDLMCAPYFDEPPDGFEHVGYCAQFG